MSTVVGKRTPGRLAERMGELLKEYVPRTDQRLHTLHELASNLQGGGKSTGRDQALFEWDLNRQSIQMFLAGMERFVRQVSQLIAHGELSELERVELELRLADLESLCQGMRDTLGKLARY